MKIESVKIDSLSADPANVRRHDKKNLAAIAASLRRFGQQKPLVVDQRNIVRAGNGTLAAALSLEWKKIEIVRTKLTGAEATAFSIADNHTGDLSDFDPTVSDLISSILADLGDIDPSLDLDALINSESLDGGAEIEIKAAFDILIECEDEQKQAALLERLTAEGVKCRALIS